MSKKNKREVHVPPQKASHLQPNVPKNGGHQAKELSTPLSAGRGRGWVSWAFWGWGLPILALLATFIILTTCESDYLLRAQELNLFLYTPLFFKQQMVVAGGMLTYAGTYFTQYFYHPWLGTLLLCLWLGLLMWLVYKAFRISPRWSVLLLVPVALVLITDFNLGYWLYYLKLRGHFFIAVMGTSAAVALVWAYRAAIVSVGRDSIAASRAACALALMVVAALAGYPLLGFYGLLAVALMGIISWRLPLSLPLKAAASILAVLLIAFVPMLYYRQVYYQANSDFIWWQALPIYPDCEGLSPYYWTYIILSLFLAVLAACYGLKSKLLARTGLWAGAQLLLVAAIVWGTWHFWFKDKTFHEEIQMNACVDQLDWEGVLSIARQHEGEPTRMMVTLKNLALFKLGRAGNEMYTYRDGARKPAADFELRMAQLSGKNLYLHYGLPNYCYRWCLEDGVEMGWRVEHLKYLVRCAILNKEYEVAQKYMDLLKQTKYYGDWAAHYEQMAWAEDEGVVKNDPELGPVLRLMNGLDILGSDQSLVELFLLNIQAYRQTDDLACAELVLISALQLKDIPTFWRAFNQYALLKKDGIIPRHYQEAAYLYGHLENHVDISHMPFDQSVRDSYEGFMQMAQRYRGMSEEQMKEVFYPRYGNTFYYNYFLMRHMKSY